MPQPSSVYVHGWKGIAAHFGRSERWCRYIYKASIKDGDPMPLARLPAQGRRIGVVMAIRADLDEWFRRRGAAIHAAVGGAGGRS